MGLNDTNGMTVNEDDDLTNLTWLQDENLLRNMSVPSDVAGNIVRILKEDNENVSPANVCTVKEVSNETVIQNVPCSVPPVPYNPQVHIHAKPPYSFSSLIFMAIESSPNKALPVKDIYSWIIEHFPYYLTAPSGWKNTVRHNLSLNKCFRKVEKAKDDLSPLGGKGSLWCIDPDLRPNLLQAVRRTPAHIYPYMSTAKANLLNMNIVQLSNTSNKNQTPKKTANEQPLFPLLTKRLLIPIGKLSRESEEADAAASMLTLTQYNSSATDVVIEGKSDQQAQSDKSCAQSSSLNPTGDHNYYIRTAQERQEQDTTSEGRHNDEEGDDVDGVLSNKVNIKKEDNVQEIMDESDDDGLKGAEALLKLASRNNNAIASGRPLSKRIRVSCD